MTWDEVPTSWGMAYDQGYRAGRADALGDGVQGLVEENARYRGTLAIIGRRGKPLSGAIAKRLARDAMDRTMDPKERKDAA